MYANFPDTKGLPIFEVLYFDELKGKYYFPLSPQSARIPFFFKIHPNLEKVGL
jgi:hypothetical protein